MPDKKIKKSLPPTENYVKMTVMPIDEHAIDSHKLHLHPQEVNKWLNGNKQGVFPLYVEISPVGHCNHRCTFCAVDYIGYKVRKIEVQRMKIILDDMSRYGVKSIMYAGEGEPLLHPDIGEIINYTKSVGIDVGITTNGVALTEKLVNECLDSITWIKVSMNGGEISYGKVHQTKQKDYETVLKNLAYAKGRRKQTTLGIQTVILPENVGELEQIGRRGQEAGADYYVLKPYSQHKKSWTDTYKGIKYADYVDAVNSAVSMSCEEFKVIARINSMSQWDEGKPKYQKCYSTPYFWAYIMATGDVYGCSAYLLDDRFNYGNINKELFSAVWLGDKRKESMRYVENDLCIDECRMNCRMDKVNQYLWELKNPKEHVNFI